MADPLVWSVGEVLEDDISRQPGGACEDVTDWDKQPGGAPANTVVALARQGVPVGILGCIGDDEIGRGLRTELERQGVNTVGLVTVANPTRIAYVLLDKTGDRQFHHFSANCADEHHASEHLPACFPGNTQILHFGTISLRVEPAASATRAAIKEALLAGLITSLDVNYRDVLWPSEEAFRDCALAMIQDAHIVKMTKRELEIVSLSSETNTVKLATAFREEHRIPLLLVTLDEKGSIAVNGYGALEVPSINVDSIDTTGAGDAFNAGIILGILALLAHQDNAGRDAWVVVQTIPLSLLLEIVTKANVMGALACTKRGAWPALPTPDELAPYLLKRA